LKEGNRAVKKISKELYFRILNFVCFMSRCFNKQRLQAPSDFVFQIPFFGIF